MDCKILVWILAIIAGFAAGKAFKSAAVFLLLRFLHPCFDCGKFGHNDCDGSRTYLHILIDRTREK